MGTEHFALEYLELQEIWPRGKTGRIQKKMCLTLF